MKSKGGVQSVGRAVLAGAPGARWRTLFSRAGPGACGHPSEL